MIEEDSPVPLHSVGQCPVCAHGLCGIRVCRDEFGLRGLVICDECEAIWREPELAEPPLYADPVAAVWPDYHHSLWGPYTHWATIEEIEQLGWEYAVEHSLDFPRHRPSPDEDEEVV
jgi:hypothetical protein